MRPHRRAPRDERALGKRPTFYATCVVYLYLIPTVRLIPVRTAALLEGGARVAARPHILTAAERSRAHRAADGRSARGPHNAIRTQIASHIHLDMQGTEAEPTQRGKRGRRLVPILNSYRLVIPV